MNPISQFAVAIAVALVTLTSFGNPVMFQPSTQLTSETTGLVIGLGTSGEARFGETRTFNASNGDVELIEARLGDTFFDVIFVTGDIAPEDYEEIIVDPFAMENAYAERLDGNITTVTMWGLYNHTDYLDYRLYAYLEYHLNAFEDVHVGINMYSHGTDILDHIAWIQENVTMTISGESVLPLADTDTLASSMSKTNAGVDITVQSTDVVDWQESGLVSETEWRGPATGTQFTWDESLWRFMFYRQDAIVIDEHGQETVIIETHDHRGMVKLRTTELDDTAQSWVDWWLSDDYRESDPNFRFTVIGSTQPGASS